jgi:serine/threonine protein phosphatase PrpC
MTGFTSVAASHVGMVRANNQDSGFAGNQLFLVADGMGGHAGGDVASAVIATALSQLDTRAFDGAGEAIKALRESLLTGNSDLSATVSEHPELAGLGTTFTGFVTIGDRLALAHIGDSRLYLYRNGRLAQITKDHTFVQRLVDSGRITEDEAKVHPRRSVLMRVLGDVDSSPEIDTQVLETQPGDIWLLCSDGLCGYVDDRDIELALRRRKSLQGALDSLIDRSLMNGAPDNVTAVLVEASEDAQPSREPELVGSAANPINFGTKEVSARTRSISTWRIPGRKGGAAEESHFESRIDEYLDELVAETKRRSVRRRIIWLVTSLLIVGVIACGLLIAYQWTQTRYYVGTDGQTVIIYQGIQQDIGPLSLDSVAEDTQIPLSDLTDWQQQKVESTLSADSLEQARDIVLRLGEAMP